MNDGILDENFFVKEKNDETVRSRIFQFYRRDLYIFLTPRFGENQPRRVKRRLVTVVYDFFNL